MKYIILFFLLISLYEPSKAQDKEMPVMLMHEYEYKLSLLVDYDGNVTPVKEEKSFSMIFVAGKKIGIKSKGNDPLFLTIMDFDIGEKVITIYCKNGDRVDVALDGKIVTHSKNYNPALKLYMNIITYFNL